MLAISPHSVLTFQTTFLHSWLVPQAICTSNLFITAIWLLISYRLTLLIHVDLNPWKEGIMPRKHFHPPAWNALAIFTFLHPFAQGGEGKYAHCHSKLANILSTWSNCAELTGWEKNEMVSILAALLSVPIGCTLESASKKAHPSTLCSRYFCLDNT